MSCRLGLAASALGQARRRRDRYASEPLSADEIARRARESWDELERQLARRAAS